MNVLKKIVGKTIRHNERSIENMSDYKQKERMEAT